ncbi:MAG: glycosyltransferase family 4 protein [Candidatus Baltobacteraceae bacterium]|jgi:glycosyltransferase involved in cell wall biosynthesis
MGSQVVLVGSYPPPYGGCSVHVQRLQRALQHEFRVEVIDLYGTPQAADDGSVLRYGVRPVGMLRALAALRRSDASIVHFHVSAMDAFLWAVYPLLSSLNSKARRIVTVHGGSFVRSFESGPAWRRAALRSILGRFDLIVTVNHEQRRFIEGLGVDARRVKVVPAFLPPVATESPRVSEVLASLQGCRPIVVSSGRGERYYGFHLILDALELDRSADRPGLILCVYDSYDEKYMAELAARRKIRCTIVRDLDPGEFAWILERSDAYVRASDRDGDAVAIREAAFFGKAVIASDCVERPVGTVLFRTGDAGALAVALQSLSQHAGPPAAHDSGRAGLEALLEAYREVLRA